jgi:hypothetical protein
MQGLVRGRGASSSSAITALAPLLLLVGFVVITHLAITLNAGCGINPARWVEAVVWQSDSDWVQPLAWIYLVGRSLPPRGACGLPRSAEPLTVQARMWETGKATAAAAAAAAAAASARAGDSRAALK